MIEVISDKNLDEVLPLLRQYLEFYQLQDIDDDKNRAFLSQFGESSEAGCQFAYRLEGQLVGFATVYFSYTTSIAAKVGILNDLYTVTDYRGKGIGRQLVEYSHQYALSKGAARLQWVTAPENKQAQALYNSMNAKSSLWLFYTYKTHE